MSFKTDKCSHLQLWKDMSASSTEHWGTWGGCSAVGTSGGPESRVSQGCLLTPHLSGFLQGAHQPPPYKSQESSGDLQIVDTISLLFLYDHVGVPSTDSPHTGSCERKQNIIEWPMKERAEDSRDYPWRATGKWTDPVLGWQVSKCPQAQKFQRCPHKVKKRLWSRLYLTGN